MTTTTPPIPPQKTTPPPATTTNTAPIADQLLSRSFLAAPDVHHDTDVATEEMLVNMGPQHPSTHGVLRLALRTDGEIVLEAVPHIGYLHRCAEKIGENLPYVQYTPYTDRMDYLAAMNNNVAWCLAVEKLANIEVPKRVDYIRVLMCELNRIASHLVSMGAYGLDMGAFTPFLYAFRERELILDLFEAACGARLTYSYATIGGLTHDLTPQWLARCSEFLDYFEPKIDEYNKLLTYNHIFLKRTGNVGILKKDIAIDYCITGAMLRGSGFARDLRKDRPYCSYQEFEFDIPTGTGQAGALGDCWDRYFVRIQEMRQSLRIVRQAIAQMPDGLHRVPLARSFKIPPGEIYMETEGARGALGFHIESHGGLTPYRVKVRGPSFCNLSVAGELCKNVLLADVPAIVGSIDIVMGETDR
jgi:NADH-quinone oxidoreductase subunit D